MDEFRIKWSEDHFSDLVDLLKDAAMRGYGDDYAIPHMLRMAREREGLRRQLERR